MKIGGTHGAVERFAFLPEIVPKAFGQPDAHAKSIHRNREPQAHAKAVGFKIEFLDGRCAVSKRDTGIAAERDATRFYRTMALVRKELDRLH